jgi:hypothetical protein
VLALQTRLPIQDAPLSRTAAADIASHLIAQWHAARGSGRPECSAHGLTPITGISVCYLRSLRGADLPGAGLVNLPTGLTGAHRLADDLFGVNASARPMS